MCSGTVANPRRGRAAGGATRPPRAVKRQRPRGVFPGDPRHRSSCAAARARAHANLRRERQSRIAIRRRRRRRLHRGPAAARPGPRRASLGRRRDPPGRVTTRASLRVDGAVRGGSARRPPGSSPKSREDIHAATRASSAAWTTTPPRARSPRDARDTDPGAPGASIETRGEDSESPSRSRDRASRGTPSRVRIAPTRLRARGVSRRRLRPRGWARSVRRRRRRRAREAVVATPPPPPPPRTHPSWPPPPRCDATCQTTAGTPTGPETTRLGTSARPWRVPPRGRSGTARRGRTMADAAMAYAVAAGGRGVFRKAGGGGERAVGGGRGRGARAGNASAGGARGSERRPTALRAPAAPAAPPLPSP